jgi:prepilin-type N-terminal cleavage/methylation domain-containing protein
MLQEMETGKEKIKTTQGKRGGKVMKRKGFTLIELVVVVAIILLLAATLAPKLRKEVAKARDAKAVAALGSTRTAVNVFLADKGYVPAELWSDATSGDFIIYDSTSEYLESNVVTFIEDNTDTEGDFIVPIGGHQDTPGGTLSYGGTAVLNLAPGTDELEVQIDGLVDSGGTDSGDEYDTKGNEWSKY